ncbi:MAG: hypothetical protein V3V96_10675, partial [Acidiferrobacterales bacterium]
MDDIEPQLARMTGRPPVCHPIFLAMDGTPQLADAPLPRMIGGTTDLPGWSFLLRSGKCDYITCTTLHTRRPRPHRLMGVWTTGSREGAPK